MNEPPQEDKLPEAECFREPMLSTSDEQAFDELFTRTSRRLMNAAAKWTLRPEDDVDDVVQETFIRAMRKWDTVSVMTPGRQDGWLHKTLYYVIKETLRNKRPFLEPIDDNDGVSPGDLAITAADRVDYDRVVRVCLKTEDLSDRQRMVFLLDLADYNSTQIGQMLGIKSPTVRVHRAAACRALKKVPEMKDMLTRYKEGRR